MYIYLYTYIPIYQYIHAICTYSNQPTTRLDWHKETEVSACRERLRGSVMIPGANSSAESRNPIELLCEAIEINHLGFLKSTELAIFGWFKLSDVN